jgi:galactokinase/mevalonate kinase-like predicted kinase
MAEAAAHGAAHARAALAGNPSDMYGGAVLAVTLDGLSAEAFVRRSQTLVVEPASELVEATVRRFSAEFDAAALATAVRWRTSVPRGVGLGGSSAIVIAVLRALCALHGAALDLRRMAELALAIETEDLGIAAGLQDRVAQAYGGLVFMEFGGGGAYEQLAPAPLPPLVVAWRADAAQDSGEVHASLRTRLTAGDAAAVAGMKELAELARAARVALIAGDHEGLARSADESFDVRRRLLALDPRHVELVECARALGAGANYTGSGGAVVAVCRDRAHAAAVARALAELGCGTLAP